MYKDYLIKTYHSFDKGKNYIKEFLDDVGKTLEKRKMIFGLNYLRGEIFYSFSSDDITYPPFESQFYTYFNDFQIIPDNKKIWNFNPNRSVVGELILENNWFYPFKYSTNDNTEFIFNLFRSFENL